MTRVTLDGRAVAWMVLLCAVWGLQQVVLKAVAPVFSPMLQIGLRSGLAALLILALLRWRGEGLGVLRSHWRAGLVAGVLFALEFVLVSLGLRYTSAGHMVVFLYTSPIFAALGLAWALPVERLAPMQWLGVLLAFGGIAVAFLTRASQPPADASAMLLGDALGLAAGLAWGATTVVIRTTGLGQLPAAHTLLVQLAVCAVLLLPLAVLTGQSHFEPSPTVWASLAFQAVGVAFASFLAWFWLLRQYVASQLGTLAFMTPLFGVALGAWWLGESLDAGFVMGGVAVLAGVVLVSSHGWFQARSAAKRAATAIE